MIQSSIIIIDTNKKKDTHSFFLSCFHQKKKKREQNSLDSILITTNPRGIQNIYILQIIWWQPYETERRREKEIKKKGREKEKRAILENRRVSQSRRVFFFTPLRERCILNVAWRKLFQKDRKCAREWTTAPKLNITSQSFVECAAIYSVSLVDPGIYSN